MTNIHSFAAVAAILLVILVSFVTCEPKCPAGYYFVKENYERPCYECYAGHYCPGDDKKYQCSSGTIAPEDGRIACDRCPSGRADSKAYNCILSDTPKKARESLEGEFEVDSKNPYWYQALYIHGFNVIQISFIDKKRSNVPVAVFASTTTGRPSKDNYEFMGVGPNVTIAIPSEKFTGFTKLLYISIVPLDVSRTTIVGEQSNKLVATYKLNATETYIPNAGSTLATYWGVEALFVSDPIAANSRVQFDISVQSLSFPNQATRYKLYYTDQKSIEYPNEYNSGLVATSDGGTVGKASFSIVNKERGPIRVAMFTEETVWNARIRVRMNITPQ